MVKDLLAKLGVSAAVAAVEQAVRNHVDDWWEETQRKQQAKPEGDAKAPKPLDFLKRKIKGLKTNAKRSTTATQASTEDAEVEAYRQSLRSEDDETVAEPENEG